MSPLRTNLSSPKKYTFTMKSTRTHFYTFQVLSIFSNPLPPYTFTYHITIQLLILLWQSRTLRSIIAVVLKSTFFDVSLILRSHILLFKSCPVLMTWLFKTSKLNSVKAYIVNKNVFKQAGIKPLNKNWIERPQIVCFFLILCFY